MESGKAPPKSEVRVLQAWRAQLVPRGPYSVTRLGMMCGLLALLGLAFPWADFVVHYATPPFAPVPTPGHGASNLFTIAGGMDDLGDHAGQVSSALVWAVALLAFAGCVWMFWHPSGAFLSAAALGLYATVVHGMLVAAGQGLRSPVDFGFSAGFWITMAVAGFRLSVPLLVAWQRRRQPALPVALSTLASRTSPTAPGGQAPDLLVVNGLTVRFFTYDGVLKALDGVSFSIREREILGIVGETGCGKSVTAKAILRLIPDPPGRITAGEVIFEGMNLLDSIEQEARIKVNKRGRARIRRNRRIARRMEALLRTVRGKDISMIFQEPSAALNPVMKVGAQIGETFVTHQLADVCGEVERTRRLSGFQRRFFARLKAREAAAAQLEEAFRALSVKRTILKGAKEARDAALLVTLQPEVDALEQQVFAATLRLGVLDRRIGLWRRIPILGKEHLMGPIDVEVRRRVVEMLKQVNIPDPEAKAEAYPFELSGGMQQRVMIAMALACRPRLLLADEPTTALDVTIQAQILSLIRGLRDQFGSSILLITHDLGVVAETCERVGVMYAGVMAEIGSASDIFNAPKHPYTVGLLRSIPETFVRTGKLSIIQGSVPSLLTPPLGCRFHPRCPFAADACKSVVPLLAEVSPGHQAACHMYDHPEFFPQEMVRQRDEGLGQGWEGALTQ